MLAGLQTKSIDGFATSLPYTTSGASIWMSGHVTLCNAIASEGRASFASAASISRSSGHGSSPSMRLIHVSFASVLSSSAKPGLERRSRSA